MFKKSKMRIFTFSMAGILAFTPVVLNTSNVHAEDGESIEDVEQKKKEKPCRNRDTYRDPGFADCDDCRLRLVPFKT